MAARLLALATLSPLLLGGAGAVSETDLYDDGRKHVPVAVLAERWRQLEAARCSGQDAQPLLWRGSVSNSTVYLLATYPVPNENMLPLSPQVQNALECADVAYFELACAPKDMGNYMAHCFHYSAQEEKDSVPSRISPQDLQALQATIAKVVQNAPPECAAMAANLSTASQALTTSRQTLRAFYHQALTTMHPSACKRRAGVQMYQESLRMAWGTTRPMFGLRDVASECAVYTGNSQQADVELARKMIANLTSDEWRANMTSNQEAMEDILHCGDLGRLKTMPGVAELPSLGEKYLGQRNQELASSVAEAIKTQQGRTILVVLGITHFLDWGTMKSVKTLIQEQSGTTFQRITTGTDLSCTASTYSAPGAKELGRCLLPPWRSQPASCDAFTKAFKSAEAAASASYPTPNKTLGIETMGRLKKSNNCSACVSSNERCECDFTWENDTNFTDLCNRTTTADGVRGMVVYMDLTRNPGSVHKGPGLAEKTVKGLYQSCIATSCDIGFRQDIALRHWYEQEPGTQLAGGIVSLRFPGQQLQMPNGFSGAVSAWPWWAWLLFALLLAACAAGLIKMFMMPPKRKKAKRAMQIGDPTAPLPVENHFQKVETTSRLDESLDRPPSPDRYEQGYAEQQYALQQQQQRQQQGFADQQYPQQQQQQPAGYSQEGPPGASWGGRPPEDGRRPEDGWPYPQLGARAFGGAELEPLTKGPMWQPQLDFAPPVDQPSPFQGYDNAILAQAMQMQQALGDAGAHAVQQMQQQSMANWQRQNMPGAPSPMQTMSSGGGSHSLQPGSLQMQAFGAGQPGQPSFPAQFQPSASPFGAPGGAPGQFLAPPGGAALFGQQPLSPQRPPSPQPALLGGMYPQPMGQAGAAPAMPFPYARMG